MKSLKIRLSVGLGFLALCMSLLFSVLLPAFTVHANEDYLLNYEFNLRPGFDSNEWKDNTHDDWFEIMFSGGDIDFFSINYVYEGNGIIHSDFYIYALSFESFEYTYSRFQIKNGLLNGVPGQININGTVSNTSYADSVYIYSLFTSVSFSSWESFYNYSPSGWPNLTRIIDPEKSFTEILDIVSSLVDEKKYEFLENGGIDWEDKDLDKDGIFDLEMEIPRLWVDYNGDGGYDFIFENAAYDTYFELQGRWYTVDDIILSRRKWSLESWQYSYQSIIKTPLSSWVDVNDKMPSIGTYNFTELGASAFNQMLSDYPILERSYSGGTNAIGNFLFGYNDALTQLQNFLLPTPESLFNGAEVYVRFWCYDEDGVLHYSKWTHWYDALADAGGSSGSRWDDLDNMYTENQSQGGLTDDEKNQLEDSGFSRNDPDAKTNNTYESDSFSQAVSDFSEILSGTSSFLGEFPDLVNTVFGFLPPWLMIFIGLGIAAIIILRVVGR